jgi:hypothetical protein
LTIFDKNLNFHILMVIRRLWTTLPDQIVNIVRPLSSARRRPTGTWSRPERKLARLVMEQFCVNEGGKSLIKAKGTAITVRANKSSWVSYFWFAGGVTIAALKRPETYSVRNFWMKNLSFTPLVIRVMHLSGGCWHLAATGGMWIFPYVDW